MSIFLITSFFIFMGCILVLLILCFFKLRELRLGLFEFSDIKEHISLLSKIFIQTAEFIKYIQTTEFIREKEEIERSKESSSPMPNPASNNSTFGLSSLMPNPTGGRKSAFKKGGHIRKKSVPRFKDYTDIILYSFKKLKKNEEITASQICDVVKSAEQTKNIEKKYKKPISFKSIKCQIYYLEKKDSRIKRVGESKWIYKG